MNHAVDIDEDTTEFFVRTRASGPTSGVVRMPLVEEDVKAAVERLAARARVAERDWSKAPYSYGFSVRRVELPAGPLGPAGIIWIACAQWAEGAARVAARRSYDDSLGALLGELLLAESGE